MHAMNSPPGTNPCSVRQMTNEPAFVYADNNPMSGRAATVENDLGAA